MNLMIRIASMVGLLMACLASSACRGAPAGSETPFNLEAARQLIAQQNERFTKAHLAGDIATIDAMFAPDARVFPPGAATVTGAQALHDFTVDYLKAGLTEFREESTRCYGNDAHVVDEGTYVVTYGPDHVTERGKYLNVWTRVNGSWKIASNMWNTDAAATEAPTR
jgi:hypothetical protein